VFLLFLHLVGNLAVVLYGCGQTKIKNKFAGRSAELRLPDMIA
jgi:hypothetical protein